MAFKSDAADAVSVILLGTVEEIPKIIPNMAYDVMK